MGHESLAWVEAAMHVSNSQLNPESPIEFFVRSLHVHPQLQRLLPRLVEVWLGAGLMDEDEAVQWLVRGKAWAEYRRIGLENCPG